MARSHKRSRLAEAPMRNQRSRAYSHAHAHAGRRALLHGLLVILAALSVFVAARYPRSSAASTLPRSAPAVALSGVTGFGTRADLAVLRPGTSHVTHGSVTALVARSDVSSVRATAAISPMSSFSSGVSAVAAASGDEDAGVAPLAERVDPTRPFVLYKTQPGDTVSAVAQRFGISVGTLLDNNPTVEDRNLISLGQELVVPRADGILHKVGHGETVESIVKQYDKITVEAVLAYRPNALTESSTLETGRYVLLPGAERKPPPPPPPPPRPVPAPTTGGGGSSGGGTPPPASGGRFSLPLTRWHGISDPFGTNRGGGRIHEGIDLDLYGMPRSTIYSSCTGVVSRVEYLTYSYGYYVVVDCGEGWSTLYAHFSEIHVVPGQRVSQGTVLGLSGVTGYTTGEHLHFEIRYFGAPVNPANYINFY